MAAGVLGALQLEAAAAHGLAGRQGDAYRYLDAASNVADRLPVGAWHLPSAFDRTRSLADDLAEQAHGAARSKARHLTSRLKATA